MRIEFVILVALAVAATFFVVIVAIALLVNKWVEMRQARSREKLYQFYSAMFAELLLQPSEESRGSLESRSVSYEQLVAPIKDGLSWSSPRRRTLHRQTIRQVLIDFSRDLSGEPLERLTYFFESFQFVDDVVALLESKKWWIRAQAARDLGLLRARKGIGVLIRALEDEHPDVRGEAMNALVVMVGVEGLRIIFRTTRNMSRWTALQLSVIVKRYEDKSVPYLLEALKSTDVSVVLFGVEMLAEIGFVVAVEPLMELAKDYPNVLVRARAAEALGRLGDQRAEPLLHELLRNPYPILRASATRALERIGSPESVPLLKGRLAEGSVAERISAARALVRSGESGVVEVRRAAGSDDPLQRGIGLQVLEEWLGPGND